MLPHLEGSVNAQVAQPFCGSSRSTGRAPCSNLLEKAPCN